MRFDNVRNYLEVLKPRASILLTFIGVSAAIIAGDGYPPLNRLLLALVTILLLSAGTNGLTNYLDRDVDVKMQRTRHRALPAKRIQPPEKVLPLTVGLVAIGIVLAWRLHPLALFSGIFGIVASVVWRKRATCVFPQGILAGCAPVLIGWFAISPAFSWELLLLCALIGLWLPLHVWSVMIANRDDYIRAGLTYFPMSREAREAVRVLLLFSLVLGFAVIALYFVGGFALLYLVVVSTLTVMMLYASVRLLVFGASRDAWRLYKLSAFPYLGLIFLTMVLDKWLL
ncbi:MAG: UbiA family prenyltransferase [Chloroflexi bacterium]|nr:UbiA family prenyltransferase [Chloroflexota bacterium]